MSNNIDNLIFNFEENFFDLINVSDLCITRAGATTLAEISFLNKPFIAIPLPYSKDNHQMMNAKYYEKKGCCWVIDQKKLDKEKLSIFIKDLLKNKKDIINKKKNLQKLNHDNTRKYIYDELKELLMKIKLAKKEIIHFIGIGGIGMSGLALIMKGQGFKVQGSDIINNKNIERLKKQKIKIYLDQSQKNLKNATIAVISSAIKKTILN